MQLHNPLRELGPLGLRQGLDLQVDADSSGKPDLLVDGLFYLREDQADSGRQRVDITRTR
jgi:hypothetical protein